VNKYFGILLIWVSSLPAQVTRIEAEAGTLIVGSGTGSPQTIKNSDPSGFSGSGYVGNFENPGDALSWTVSPGAGTYELRVGFASPTGAKTVNLKINSLNTTFEIHQTAQGAWSEVLVGRFDLLAGSNTIEISPNWTWFKIDYIEIEPVAADLCFPATTCEAETADLQGPTIGNSIAGYSGSGYAAGFTDASHYIEFPVQVTAPGRYALEIRYTTSGSAKTATLEVNGSTKSINLPQSDVIWASRNQDTISFLAGQNSLKIKANWTHFNIDFIKLTPALDSPPLATPPATLSDPNPTPQAQALFSWFIDNYGSKTLSGQQNDYLSGPTRPIFAETKAIADISGEVPLILGGDYMEFSNSRLLPGMGTKPANYTEEFIDSAQAGHIITMMWHWGAPMDNINGSGDQAWYKNFYTNATNYDLAYALANTQSQQYQLLIADMDSVAKELKKFQDANIPVLWRPLHESQGTWFWWGAYGSSNFKTLWRLMYDRYVNHHGLHNLIWVFTDGGSDAWYPGDDVVDIVGLDIYTSNKYDPLVLSWEAAKSRFNGRKMLALTEFGGIADVSAMQAYGVWWLYVASWTGPYASAGYTTSEVQALYTTPALSNLSDVNVNAILTGGPTHTWLQSQTLQRLSPISPIRGYYNIKGKRISSNQVPDSYNGVALQGQNRRVLIQGLSD
jgi:mannan endo-1,4-beta-mannosidase